MAEFRLTPKQEQAVNTRGRSILVSAAAGSGKTSVLSQRIVELICAESAADIRRMLICTYTNAAAAEMRERISRRLADRAEALRDPRLAAQAEYVSQSDICTIHRFAGKLVSENTAALGLPSTVRVCGKDEADVLLAKSMERAFERLYEDENASFLVLRDRYGKRTDKEFMDIIKRLYEFCASKPEGIEWLKNAAADREALRAGYTALLEKQISSASARLLALGRRAQKLARLFFMPEAQAEKNAADIELAEALAEMISRGDYESALHYASAAEIQKRIALKIEESPGKDELKRAVGEERGLLKNLRRLIGLRVGIDEALEDELAEIGAQSQMFYEVVCAFKAEFDKAKRERGVIDFDDMIVFGHRVMQNEEAAAACRERYDYVFIDEYQDTNPVQEALLARVSRRDNRFMVGDIKQSIYRFRLADPLIFLKKAREYEGRAADGKTVIHMNDNFRSAPGVTGPINLMMSALMSRGLGEIDYDENEALVPGVSREGSVELLLTDKKEDSGEDGEMAGDGITREAHTLARRIKRLLGEKIDDGDGERYIRYGDICVLLRKTKNVSGAFGRIFAEYGIPTETPEGKSVSETDIEIFVNLLWLIDDPARELPLLSVMRSHIGGFDERDMCDIRAAGGSFAEGFTAAKEGEGELAGRLAAFSRRIERWRLLARTLRLADLLILLKNETAYEAHIAVLPGGDIKADRFRAFFAQLTGYAAHEASLYALVDHLEWLKSSSDAYYDAPDSGAGEDCVRIMTIHKSKGLEFPVVILARTSSRFDKRDLKKPILIHAGMGIAFNLINEKKRTVRAALTRELMAGELETQLKSEELRILYVALTRARCRLIISGLANGRGEIFSHAHIEPCAEGLLAENDMLSWILTALLPLDCFSDWRGSPPQGIGAGTVIEHSLVPADTSAQARERSAAAAAVEVRRLIEEAAQAPYEPFLRYSAEKLPVKIGVSSVVAARHEAEGTAYRYSGQRPALSAAQLGTLVHLVMLHLDWRARTAEDISHLLLDMEKRRLLSPAERICVQPFAGNIAAFLNSDLAYRIRRSPRVMKEVPFSLRVPARDICMGESDESIVVQGIMDLVFEEEGGLVLLDYKSNNVTRETLAEKAALYRAQLDLYARALFEISGCEVKEKYLYFLRADAPFLVS